MSKEKELTALKNILKNMPKKKEMDEGLESTLMANVFKEVNLQDDEKQRNPDKEKSQQEEYKKDAFESDLGSDFYDNLENTDELDPDLLSDFGEEEREETLKMGETYFERELKNKRRSNLQIKKLKLISYTLMVVACLFLFINILPDVTDYFKRGETDGFDSAVKSVDEVSYHDEDSVKEQIDLEKEEAILEDHDYFNEAEEENRAKFMKTDEILEEVPSSSKIIKGMVLRVLLYVFKIL